MENPQNPLAGRVPDVEPSARVAASTATRPDDATPDWRGRPFLGQPGPLANLFSVELWERFSFYGMQAMLVYYMSWTAAEGGLGIDPAVATGIVGAYGGMVYVFCILGGWVADRLLGSERTMFVSAVGIMLGHIALALVPGVPGLTLGLVLVAVGSGGLKANAANPPTSEEAAYFERLAQQELDWAKVTISLADERWVPVSHPDSNEGLLRRHLLQGPAAAARLVGLYQSAASLEQAAERADAVLAKLPPIDVLVLGMGEDGHTASLFPDSPNLEAALDPRGVRRCLPMQAPSVPRQRLSMSLALLASARLTLLALHGPGKLATLNQALAGESYEAMPIRAFLARPLEIYWCP